MEEYKIVEVAKVLQEWNPLGDRAEKIKDLDGYRVEAIDIISTVNLFEGDKKYNKAVKQVLVQAFNLSVSGKDFDQAAMKIKLILS